LTPAGKVPDKEIKTSRIVFLLSAPAQIGILRLLIVAGEIGGPETATVLHRAQDVDV
jgi:hypothetical protein